MAKKRPLSPEQVFISYDENVCVLSSEKLLRTYNTTNQEAAVHILQLIPGYCTSDTTSSWNSPAEAVQMGFDSDCNEVQCSPTLMINLLTVSDNSFLKNRETKKNIIKRDNQT